MTKKRILVTGASGFVAGSILHFGARDHEMHALSREEAPENLEQVQWHTCDPNDDVALDELFNTIKPDAIIHAAAIADIDFCKRDPDTARKVNVEFTRRLAERALRTRFVFISTDNVYEGTQERYTENCPTDPVNYYGQTKLEAEGIVLNTLPDAVVVRLALVMGFPIIGAGNSFLMRMIETWERGDSVGVPNNETRSPIDLVTAGKALLELAINDATGIVLLGGLDGVRRIELARTLAEAFGYGSDCVHETDPRDIPGRSDRPETVVFDLRRTQKVLRTPMRSIREAIELVKPFKR